MEVMLPIQLPDSFKDELKEDIKNLALNVFSQTAQGLEDLPPYPKKAEVKKVLHIGEDKLNQWISEGLHLVKFSANDHRIDKEELKMFLNSRKI
ncbi:DNA-binding protein [Enterococcus faecalis]|uniref:hypothetical protein n=1 Tax=Enterococcus TaxID=1350 RepID=UPI000459B92D|nr:hypothetical protein [Enterococcus faecalis]EGO8528062.1 DNA-binding protein [Enterococcus faecalis]EHB4974687.1 DNA-binding protein [Enterococcus faecalis]EHS2293275.1 DNA-binding protein [Enterococcus faecalis]EJX8002931.1 DNA-binding protein [Enterococcus faecalis]EJX8004001.1 DNA-binding protein [Enterococcus faecalis]